MKISFISDLHIKKPGDLADELFHAFANSEQVANSDHIVLLGDMFDALVGEHSGYFKKYSDFFNTIVKWLEDGKTVTYIEGNHDFHFSKSLEKFLKSKTSNHGKFNYKLSGVTARMGNKQVYYCHGYEVDYYNEYFQRWYNIYSSSYFKFFISNLIPYFAIESLTRLAAKDSKRRGKKTFSFNQAKQKYIDGAKAFLREKPVDVVICGHTHIKEFHEYEDGKLYVNCGYPQKDKEFLYFNGDTFGFVSLTVS